MSNGELPDWVPADVQAWVWGQRGKLPYPWDRLMALCTDDRMKDVWVWYKCEREGLKLEPGDFCWMILHALRLPTKPGDMPRKRRDRYMAAVRATVKRSVSLLEGTRFGQTTSGPDLCPGELQEPLTAALGYRGDSEPRSGRVVAYLIDRTGVWRLPPDYPLSHLVDSLGEVLDWTEWEDRWDTRRSSAALPQPRARNRRTIYFVRTLSRSLEAIGLKIPFAKLATIANVALQSGDDNLLDEAIVRKQVRRWRQA